MFFFLISTINLIKLDVYDAIPTIVTCFVAIIAKISILIFLLDMSCILVRLICRSTLEIKINPEGFGIILIIEIWLIYSKLISLFNLTQLINILRFYEIFKINKFSNYGLNFIICLQSSLAYRRRFYSTSSRDPRYKTGWQVRVSFSITLHKKDRPLLEHIKQQSRGLGQITNRGMSLFNCKCNQWMKLPN